MKTMKKVLSVMLVAVMLLTAVPLQGFVGLNVSSLFASEAKAAGITDSDGETYWAMSHDEAVNFIGFIYDRSKLSEDELNAGGLYTFLTGGFERGSIEEYSAKLAFLMTAKSNLSQCFNSYSQVADEARQYLYDYLIDQVSVGSLTLDGAEEVVDTIIFYSSEIIEKLGTDVADILNILEKAKKYNDSLTNVDAYVDNLFAIFNGFVYMWGSSKSAMYQYVSSYIQNRSLKNSCSDAFELLNDYNKFALVDGSLYDPFLDWASDDHIATLERFGDYIYFVSKSFNYNGSVFEPTDDLSEYKVIDVQCPTDVYVYNKDGELLLSIVGNEILNISTNISASVYDNKKRVALPLSCEYDVVIKGTDEGVMDYYIYEIFNDSIMRTVEHNSVPLTEGCIYTSTIPVEVYTDVENYNITSETGEEIEADYDSLPPIEDNIVDVIVAEELFDGFPVEIIDLVADTMFNMQPVVDLTAYDISTEDAVALYSAVAKYYPAEYSLIANSDFTYKIIVSPNLDRIMKIRFYYGDDANLSTYQKRVNDLNAEIDALVAQVEGMTEFEKALYIHDYIVLHSEYDLELLEYMEANNFTLPGELRSEKYTEYSILVNGTGVCGSYALAYRAVLNAAGMECLYLSSREMNHAWNLVKIDGNWYHVDCCWDDPVPDTYGRARRTYFLRTDSEIMNLNHYTWSPGQYKATSEKYSDMPRGYDIQQKYDNGKWYYVKGTTLYSSDEYGKNETEITSMSASSIDVDDKRVYFSTGRYIYEYDMETSKKNLVYMLSNKDSGENLSTAYLSNIYVADENVEFYKSIYKDSKQITVFETDSLQRDKFAAITGIEINQSDATLDVFETLQLSANIITTGSAKDMEVEWRSSDESIVKVDSKGNLTAANVGSSIITASVADFKVTCEVTVTGDGLSGLCNSNLKWDYDPSIQKLTLIGEGSVPYMETICQKFYDEIKTICFSVGITGVDSSAFQFCTNLEEIIIPDSLTKIGQYAFRFCRSLIHVIIPKSVTIIGDNAFDNCTSLKSFMVDENNEYYSSDEYGVLFDKEKITMVQFPSGNFITKYTVPNSVKNIIPRAFFKCSNLIEVMVPAGVKKIASYTFSGCSRLEKVAIYEGLTEIENYAFQYCTSLESVIIPDSVTQIDSGAFHGCISLKHITLSESLMGISSSTFSGCSELYSITIPASVTSIDNSAFSGCTNLIHVGYKGTKNEFLSINIGSDNTCLTNTAYLHYNFDPDADLLTISSKSATCTEDGNTEVVYCIDCQCYLDGEVIPATGHSYSITESVEGTCVTAPYDVYICSSCSEVEVLETTPATGKHNYQIVSTVHGNCIAAPVNTYECSYCGDTYTKEGRIEEGHSYETTVVAPTCDEKGYTKEICTVCGETLLSDFTSPKGHEFLINKSVDYCSAHGTLEYSCKNCDYTESVASNTEDLVTETVTVEPTCTKSGSKTEICTLCGATVSTEILNPLSHKYSDEYTVDLEATCTTEGRKSQHCTRCDAKRAVTEIPSSGHTAEILPAKAATCTATGLTEGKKCTVCGETTLAQTVIAKKEHSKTTINQIPATETEVGYTGDVVCSVCGTEISKGKVIPAKGENSTDTNCDHLCHKDGFIGFIWKIVQFFWKLFGMNPVCECGAAHY